MIGFFFITKLNFDYFIFSAILVSGGKSLHANFMTSVEVLFPNGTRRCALPDLPKGNFEHSQDGLMVCGGQVAQSSCFTLSNGQWTLSHHMLDERYSHCSWAYDEERVMLMGGSGYTTTEIISPGHFNTTPGFTLKYNAQ